MKTALIEALPVEPRTTAETKTPSGHYMVLPCVYASENTGPQFGARDSTAHGTAGCQSFSAKHGYLQGTQEYFATAGVA